MFAPLLADYGQFCGVVDPDSGTVGWPNGADWAPDQLYAQSKAAVPV